MTYEIKYRKEDEMKDSGIEWLGKVPKDWELCKIKNISVLKTGDSISATDKDSKYSNLLLQYYPYIGTKDIDISTNIIEYDNDLYIPKKTQFKVAKENTVLICIEGGSAGRKIGYLNRKSCYGNKLCNIEGNNKIINKLLYYILQSDHFAVEFFNKMTGIIPGVSIEDFKNINSILPNPKDQEKISDFLDFKTSEFDSIISKKEKLIVKLEEAKKSLVSEVVTGKVKIVDGEIVERKAEEMKDSGVEWIGMIPKDWQVKRIKDLFELRNERNSKKMDQVQILTLYTSVGIRRQEDVENKTGNKVRTVQDYKIVYPEDIVVNIILAWMGAIGVSMNKGVISPAYDIYKPLNNINSTYYNYLFRTPKFSGECFKYGRGIMLMRWRTYSDEFRSIYVCHPLESEQNRIIDLLNKKNHNIDISVQKQNSKSKKLKLAKQSLISEAVTGKIDLSDWEII